MKLSSLLRQERRWIRQIPPRQGNFIGGSRSSCSSVRCTRRHLFRPSTLKERIKIVTTHTVIAQFNEHVTMINQMLAAVEQRHREADSPASQGQFQAGIAIGLLIAELESDAR